LTQSGYLRPVRNEMPMKKPPVTALSLSLSLVATATSAGRLTAADVEGKPEATTSRQTNWVLPVLIGGIVLYALAGGGNDDSPGGADTGGTSPTGPITTTSGGGGSTSTGGSGGGSTTGQ
jgi:hypothetical protein